MNSKQTVFVGLSGGVDSSVAALRLKKAGYNVVGVFIKVWHPAFLECHWEAERLDAMRVAAHLDIPFLTCDAADAYKQEVADHFIAEYSAGRTPNPDVLCNKAVKFGHFFAFAKELGADYIATGHYARVSKHLDLESDRPVDVDTGSPYYELLRGVDENKDQSYFLWTLTQQQLAFSLFPIGDTPKHAIRQEAHTASIPVATKKDSQGICFLGHIDIPSFLAHYIELNTGPVLAKNGDVIGHHQGALVYTRGQRHGFLIHAHNANTERYYVVDRDIEKNTITVDTTRPTLKTDDTITLHSVNWIHDTPREHGSYSAQFRYRQNPVRIKFSHNNRKQVVITILDPVDNPASGQSCVLYDGDTCLGGGIIA